MMLRVPADARHEVKFVTEAIRYHEIRHWLRMHPALFISAYPPRTIHNIYFDSHNYTAYTDNLMGESSRIKLRYRWYGDSDLPTAGQLEVKCRRNLYGWKQIYKIPEAPYAAGDDWRTVRGKIRAQLPPEGLRWLDANPFAALMNRYHRDYFATLDGGIRVTLDTASVVYDQRIKPSPNVRHKAHALDTVVVEIKFSRSERQRASELLHNLPIRVSRHSKYIVGMQAILGRAV